MESPPPFLNMNFAAYCMKCIKGSINYKAGLLSLGVQKYNHNRHVLSAQHVRCRAGHLAGEAAFRITTALQATQPAHVTFPL